MDNNIIEHVLDEYLILLNQIEGRIIPEDLRKGLMQKCYKAQVQNIADNLVFKEEKTINFEDNVLFGYGTDFEGMESFWEECETQKGKFAIWKEMGKEVYSVYGGVNNWMAYQGFDNMNDARFWIAEIVWTFRVPRVKSNN